MTELPRHLFLERDGESVALYCGGDLQFDTSDEAIYHEALVHPLLGTVGADRRAVRVLVCGGGDGLAVREVLRWPGVEAVDLVDHDPAMLELARSELAAYNQGAFEDPRVRVHCADAFAWVGGAEGRYDAIICDLTMPAAEADARFHDVAWYRTLRARCASGGGIAVNACSPEASAAAYWSIEASLRCAGLRTQPYHVYLPSFARHGFGDWGFILALGGEARARPFTSLPLPRGLRFLDRRRLRALRYFPRHHLALRGRVEPTMHGNGAVWRYLLNGAPAARTSSGEAALQLARAAGPRARFPSRPPRAGAGLTPRAASELLLHLEEHLPVQHRYHTRDMLAALWEDPWPYLERLDLRRLLSALLECAELLPRAVARELRRAAATIRDVVPDLGRLAVVSERIVVALVIAVVVANSVFPDGAFAKGSPGAAHFSIAHSSGYVASSHATAPATLQDAGFARVTARSGTVDAFGTYYPRTYYRSSRYLYDDDYYYAGGSYSSGSSVPPPTPSASGAAAGPAASHLQGSVYYLTDDSQVLANGDTVVSLGDRYFLQVAGDALLLTDRTTGDEVTRLYREPDLVGKLQQEVQTQRGWIQSDLTQRQAWISWVGWLRMLPVIGADVQEAENLLVIAGAMQRASQQLAALRPLPRTDSLSEPHVQLFAGVDVLNDGILALHMADGTRLFAAGGTAYRSVADARARANPVAASVYSPRLASALAQVLGAFQTDLPKQIADIDANLASLQSDQASLQQQQQYLASVLAAAGNDRSYQITYGDQDMSVGAALDQIAAGIGPGSGRDRAPDDRPLVARRRRRSRDGRQAAVRHGDAFVTAMELAILDERHDRAWDPLALTNPASGFMQTSLWARFKEAEGYAVTRVGLREGGELIGGALCYAFPSPGTPGVLMMPHGPVLPWGRPDAARRGLELLLAWARDEARARGAYGLRIEPLLPAPLPPYVRDWIRAPLDLYPYETLVLDLTRGPDAVLAGMRPKCRYNVGLACRRGVEVTSTTDPSALRTFYGLFKATASRHRFYAEPYGFFINLVTAARGTGAVRFYVARRDGAPLAAALVLHVGPTATFLYGGSADVGRRDMASYALQWAIVQEAAAAGLRRYDMYGYEPTGDASHPYAGFSRFKRQFGGQAVTCAGAHDYVFYDGLARAVAGVLGRPGTRRVV